MNEVVTDTAQIGVLIGLILPMLVAVLNRPHWSSQQKQAIAVGIAIIAGIATVLTSGTFSLENWLLTLTAVVGAAQVAYTTFYKPTHLAKAIELRTTPKGQQDTGSRAA